MLLAKECIDLFGIFIFFIKNGKETQSWNSITIIICFIIVQTPFKVTLDSELYIDLIDISICLQIVFVLLALRDIKVNSMLNKFKTSFSSNVDYGGVILLVNYPIKHLISSQHISK